jgi:hypothetical protein
MKKVTIGGKPTAKSAAGTPDDWVAARSGSDEPMKRLTIDIPLTLHQRVKSQCALKGEKMADAVRGLLDQHFGKLDEDGTANNDQITNVRKHDSVTFSNHDDDQTGN